MKETVVVLGASNKPDRYAYKALKLLAEYGHDPIPVNPRLKEIDGTPCLPSLSAVDGPVDTVTVYLRPQLLQPLLPEIVAKKPRRVILNPGTEDGAIEDQLTRSHIPVQKACTLVLLKTNQYLECCDPAPPGETSETAADS